MTTRSLGSFNVNPIGLGCMNLDHAYGPSVSPEQGERVLLGALDAGYDFFDTATLYGGGKNETRLGEVLKKHRNRFVLASKCVLSIELVDGKPQRVTDGRPETVRKQCEASLRRLQTDVIDLYYLHRWDQKVPIEDSVGALSDMVRKGHIRAIGLSEVGAKTLRKAHAVHPITAVQSEYSLWARDPEVAVLDACKELGVAFVAFSSLARKFLCGLKDVNTLHEKDIRRSMPRFQAGAFEQNLQLLAPFESLAQALGHSPAQLALAWVLAKGDHILSIPGTTSEAHMRENFAAANITLSPDVIQRLDGMVHPKDLVGGRYDAQSQSEVDTEQMTH
jgi:aryl-alcohol dehydrogenase-like predicted oxidoreductase